MDSDAHGSESDLMEDLIGSAFEVADVLELDPRRGL